MRTQERPLWQCIAGLMVVMFISCMVGIFSRPLGFTSAFWPANAIMLGLLLRNPRLSRSVWAWAGAWLAYVFADLVTGSSMFVALTLNSANVFSVLCGWLFLRNQSPEVLSFKRQRSVLTIFLACIIAASTGALTGAWPSHIAFNAPISRTALMWLASEFFNWVLILPIMLSAPRGWIWNWQRNRPRAEWTWFSSLPLLALVLSEVLSLMMPGPGAMAFIMPAMVWCAMTYGVFPITLLNLVMCFWKTMAIALGAFTFTPEHMMEVTSFRTGLALMSLAPLAVACAYALRMQALQKLNHAVNHDFLTGVLARRALMERGQKLLSRIEEEGKPVAVLMMDIDHFKSVNDRYGHAQGDVVLQEFAHLAQDSLRPEDLLGRTGGEEFAIVLPRTTREQALIVAQRICDRLREHIFPLPNQQHMQVTLSIGLHSISIISPQDTMEQLLSKADEALYLAKNSGRDQVRQYGPALAPSTI